MMNCGAIQRIERDEPTREEFRRFFSTNAAETMENVATKRPVPTRWRGEMPELVWVMRRARGTKAVS